MSELRQDLVSGDWVIMVPERAKRPDEFLSKKEKRKPTPKAKCPFEDLKKTGNWPPLFLVPNDEKRWRVAVIPNKYPALQHGKHCMTPQKLGPYTRADGIGWHNLVIGKDHYRNLADMSPTRGVELFQAMQRLFRIADRDKCMAYVSLFFNWGATAGASLYHPHYQALTLPIIPPEVAESLTGSERYWKRKKRCVHCDILTYETKARSRIIAENARAVAFTPYVPKSRLEVSIYPKRHFPFFERTPKRDLAAVVAILRSVMRSMRKRLNDPDLNFFVHTAPIREQNTYHHYHWHIDVIPKLFSPPGGFELSTGTDINAYDPDWLAALLRGQSNH